MSFKAKKFIGGLLAATLAVSSATVVAVAFTPATIVEAASTISVTKAAGWFESAYVQWSPVSGASQYKVYVKGSSGSYTQLDDPLIRSYGTYWRADAVGLAAGTYTMKVDALNSSGSVIASVEKSGLSVSAYDRSGAAFSSKSTYKTASGAYNDNGTLKSGAVVIYITPETAKTVKCDVVSNAKGATTTYTGFQNIITGLQKGYDTRAFDFRIVGCIDASNMDSFGSSAEGLQVKGKAAYSQMNMTIEGIGEDACIKNFGILIRNAGNVEIRNFGIMLCMDDALSLDTSNCNIWVHNMDCFYGATGGDADQAKGDGTMDVKSGSTFVTFSYNHFWDNGKSSLCGMKSESSDSFITYHHNWFDHSDSRHPRIRTMSVHIYNNYFDSCAKYGVGMTMGGSAFVEQNYFLDTTKPMMISGQGTDAKGDGTFSGENGGVIKAYNNKFTFSKLDSSKLSYINQNSICRFFL
jgi:pectate lyase